MSAFKGADEAPNLRYDVLHTENAGSPTGCEPQGDGVLVVVRKRESRSHGEGGQAIRCFRRRGARDA